MILSGSGSDGTLGLAEIKAAGGITFAQDKESAKFDGMPHSAIASGFVDFILPPKEIARELARVGCHPYLVRFLDGRTRPGGRPEEESLPEDRCAAPVRLRGGFHPVPGRRRSGGGPCAAWPFTPRNRSRTTLGCSKRIAPSSRPFTRTSSST